MKSFHFHPEALLEADKSAKFYEERQAGLGKTEFEPKNNNQILGSLVKMINNPENWLL